MNKSSIIFIILSFCVISLNAQRSASSVYVDEKGVIRWTASKKEVSLYGANYCLPSACDYRAAGYVGGDRKKMIDQDMAHFARMSFDAVRLCLWGDFENTDKDGNLIKNDHLDLMDYLILKAKERGISMLLSPIVTYSSKWPDAMGDTTGISGSISMTFKKDELGTNPKAIAAQCNYISQLLNHVNPYTKLALKDDPSIIFVEMINEPTHHSSKLEGSVNYINALIEAVRRTGCNKLVFHNLSQDFDIDKAMGKSKVQGASFAWYPSGLNSGRTLKTNFLPAVDKFSDRMLSKDLEKLGRIVYEFDIPDQVNGYMYPAMARSFRQVGAQWATLFSYDMLATAPYNLGWQTHYFNMIYTPEKAVGGMISAEIMRRIPMYKDYGKYPQNTSFSDFRLNYDEDLAELNSEDKFYYTNNTKSKPVAVNKLTKIAGHGSSLPVQYEGKGIYFLDKIDAQTWRLEVYPDALPVKDPFEMPSPDKIVTRSVSRTWPIKINLPGLGSTYKVIPLNENNNYKPAVSNSAFAVRPGVYILTAAKNFRPESLPEKFSNINMREFETLPDQILPMQVFSGQKLQFSEGAPLVINADIYSSSSPDSVTLFLKTANSRRFMPYVMKRKYSYTYEAVVPWNERISPGAVSWCIVVREDGKTKNYPSGIGISPSDWNFSGCETWNGRVIAAEDPIKLVEPEKDLNKIAFTRIGDGIRTGIFKMITSSLDGSDAIHFELPLNLDKDLDDYTLAVPVKEKLQLSRERLLNAKDLVLTARGAYNKQEAFVTLVEKDGTSWSSIIPVSGEWQNVRIPLENFKIGRGVMLPLGYPGRWNYWFNAASGRGGEKDKIELSNIEQVQLSIRQAKSPGSETAGSYLDVSKVYLSFR